MSEVTIAFVRSLEQEVNQVEELNLLLESERVLLQERRYEELEDMAEKKTKLSDSINELARKRMDLIQSNKDDKKAVNAFLSTLSESDVKLVQAGMTKLTESLARCKELNAINGQIIATNMQIRSELVDALKGHAPTDATRLYTSTGALGDRNR